MFLHDVFNCVVVFGFVFVFQKLFYVNDIYTHLQYFFDRADRRMPLQNKCFLCA